jgi:hypothetical protein
MKKGEIGQGFNWILILVIGALVLVFFFGVITKQKEISSFSSDTFVLRSLDSLLSGSLVSSPSTNFVKVPNLEMEFTCGRIIIGDVPKQITDISIFSASTFKGNEIAIFSNGWNVPYSAADFLYLVDPKTRYIFIGSSGFSRNVFQNFPEGIRNDGYTNVNLVKDENDNKIRIIFFGTEPEVPEDLENTDVSISALRIDGDHTSGIIEFFDFSEGKFKSGGISYYIGLSSLFGSIFADSLDVYVCAMEQAFDRLNMVSKVYNEKVKITLVEYAGTDDACTALYDGATSQLSDDFSLLSSVKFSNADINRVLDSMTSIGSKNHEAIDLSCVPIY